MMKLFCNGQEFAARLSPYTRAVPPTWGDGEINVFLAESKNAFSRDSKWEIEKDSKRVEVAIRAESPVDYVPPAGTYTALFTAPAVG
jgi:hypothetical protein